MKKLCCLFALVSLLFAPPALAGFDEGVAAYKQRDYESALREILPLAEQGHAEAQHLLGKMYRIGKGVEKDYLTGVEWHRKAAKNGHLADQIWLSSTYYHGNPLNGVPQDFAESIKWLRMAAEQGDAESQYNLGFMHGAGEGTQADHDEALRWYLAAALQEYSQARLNIAWLYFFGEGVPQDFVQSYMWLELSNAPPGSFAANLRKDLVAKMKPEQISEAEKLAREWTPAHVNKLLARLNGQRSGNPDNYAPTHDEMAERYLGYVEGEFRNLAHYKIRPFAEQGNPRAQTILAIIYAEGLGVEKDMDEAIEWYGKAIFRNDTSQAHNNLGYIYSTAWGVEQDFGKAVQLYRMAAQHGHPWAQFNLAFMYEQGRGVEQSFDEAGKWYRKAAEQDFAEAQAALGILQAYGPGMLRDFNEAVKWYRRAVDLRHSTVQSDPDILYIEGQGARLIDADINRKRQLAENGDIAAQSRLGVMYFLGEGVSQDMVQSYFWTRLAAIQRDIKSGELLAYLNQEMSAEQIAEAEKLAQDWGRLNGVELNVAACIPTDGKLRTISDFIRGFAALEIGNFDEALRDIHPLAEQCFSEAQLILGTMFLYGEGVPVNEMEGIRWYRKVANKGHFQAQMTLAAYYSKKVNSTSLSGAEANYYQALGIVIGILSGSEAEIINLIQMSADQGFAPAQAWLVEETMGLELSSDSLKWALRAAEQGEFTAQYKLAEHFDQGAHDYEMAAFWILNAAKQGLSRAQSALSEYHAAGLGVPQNLVQAHMWANLASRNRYFQAMDTRFTAYGRVNENFVAELEAEMTSKQIEEAERLAREWVPGR